MKTAYVKAPFIFEVRDENLREINDSEVLIKVMACGICGTDIHTAATQAQNFETFGHEIAGVVEEIGKNVKNVEIGDKVTVESCTFDRYSNNSRNGDVNLDLDGPRFAWGKEPMGFSEYMIATMEQVVKFESLSFPEATIIEPMGVALDLVYTADIKLNDDVLVIGLGPIGLMAVQLAKLQGARNIYVAEFSDCKKRIELAKKYGATEVIFTDKQSIEEYQFARGGVDKILVTAPPKMLPLAIKICNFAGSVAFIGIQFGAGADITFDANDFHFKRLQLKASYAAPALYFPRCIELVESGAVDVKSLISDKFKLCDIQDAFDILKTDKENTVKVVIENE